MCLHIHCGITVIAKEIAGVTYRPLITQSLNKWMYLGTLSAGPKREQKWSQDTYGDDLFTSNIKSATLLQ